MTTSAPALMRIHPVAYRCNEPKLCDTIRSGMEDETGRHIFGAINQKVGIA